MWILTLYGHIKTIEQWTIIQNTAVGTLAVDTWAVTFGTARRGLGPPINGQCTNFISLNVVL